MQQTKTSFLDIWYWFTDNFSVTHNIQNLFTKIYEDKFETRYIGNNNITLGGIPIGLVLSKKEYHLFKQIQHKETKKIFFCSKYMQKTILSKYIGINYNELEIYKTKKGRPFIDYEINFNISHSTGLITLIIGKTEFLGIDIEHKLNSYAELESITSSLEKSKINLIKNENEQLNWLLKTWVKKEAYLKALGIGLVDDLQNVHITKNDVVKYKRYQKLFLKNIPINNNYIAYFCCENPDSIHCLKDFTTLNKVTLNVT